MFLSHQWTGWNEPDACGTQYEHMRAALNMVITEYDWGLERTYVWLDYVSIPQDSKNLQQLAINALPLYASLADAFIAVTPARNHQAQPM